MKQLNFSEKIEIPEGVEFNLEASTVTVKAESGEVTKEFKMPRFKFAKEGNALVISCPKYGIYDKRNHHTIKAHINNMVKGAKEGYTYLLKICSSHFPMNVSLNGNKFVVKNLFGEKVPRELIIKEGAKVVIKESIIEVTGTDLEKVSMVAAEIEKLTRISNRDRRIFQDGIYITHKAGKQV